MSLDVAYSYCTKLTEQEKLDIDKQVRKNLLELRFAIFFSIFPFPMFPTPIVPFFPVEGFSPQQIVAEEMVQTSQFVDDCAEAYNEYKVYSKMSATLTKVSNKVRKDEEINQSLENLREQLKDGEFHAGRGAKKLKGSKTIFYLRSGNAARLFFKYSEEEKGAVEIVAESNKKEEESVIKNIKKNYK